MPSPTARKAAEFRALHVPGRPLLQPNAFDAGSARLLAAAGFAAVATTSSGFAATLGRGDGSVTRDEALAHFRALAGAVDVPVAADSENCYADDPAGVAETVRLLADTGLAGFSIEDYDRGAGALYDQGLAVERVAAAVQAARAVEPELVVTARAEAMLYGGSLDDALARVEAFAAAGADVLFAPGVRAAADIERLVGAVDKPVNVLVLDGCPPLAALADLGVARISVGGALTWLAYGAVLDAAAGLLDAGSTAFLATAGAARPAIRRVLEGD
jgi:2-methylisocitrate lyase-like PEP mutase family enzyme